MTYSNLLVTLREAQLSICLNRPELRNAFNDVMVSELKEVFLHASNDTQVRVVVLSAAGRSFCAGADLNWMKRMADYSHAENQADAMELARMLYALYRCDKPVIARVQGDCYAGGMGLIAAADIAIASRDARFCLSEARLGLIPATISPYLLQAIGERAARRYFLSAERFDASEALRIGLIHAVVEPERLDQTVDQIVLALRANSGDAMREAKRLVREVAPRSIDEALLAFTAERIATIRASAHGREGVDAFLNKRDPAWFLPEPKADR